jgi:phenylalanyl-tRNA synthetase alpha chain
LEKTLEQIKKEALKELEAASDSESIKALSVRYLGRKGVVTQYLRDISNLPSESKQKKTLMNYSKKP